MVVSFEVAPLARDRRDCPPQSMGFIRLTPSISLLRNMTWTTLDLEQQSRTERRAGI